MRWVYSVGTEKPNPVPLVEQLTKPKTGFFSSLFGLGGNTPQRTPSPLPQPVVNEAEYFKVDQYSVVLTIFTADVDVRLSQKISTELHRSTKKNPPRTLKYELIYVSHASTTPLPRDVNLSSRRERTSMMPARKRMASNPRQRAVFSKACGRTWMGGCDSQILNRVLS